MGKNSLLAQGILPKRIQVTDEAMVVAEEMTDVGEEMGELPEMDEVAEV